ncbi:hypothetical protein [Thiothrix fructosivorans]|uniref:Uncharacterized protein n=1 Tax=Thiothrix fructosivorans TaxID=111770 RepID=A0A8B0SR28_9GAMM|nr:hypothetical protein [Thiothrix fructosivorans]MBO0611499.1 hypothetical protein [Thiothrix fructosivorans]QTX13080.1 hypothetical protein J1836_020480 [Thiothrix fructosivorans]
MKRAVTAEDGTEVVGIGVEMVQAIAAESPISKEFPIRTYPDITQHNG